MSLRRIFAWAALAASFAAVNATTALATPLDSSEFSHQYNGDVVPVPNYSRTGSFTGAPSTDGDILNYQGSLANTVFWTSDEWAGVVSDATGWTFEIRIRIEDNEAEGPNGAFQFVIDDGAGGVDWRSFQIGKSFFNSSGFGGVPAAELDTNDNTDEFHTFRLAQVGSSSDFMVWRDGVSLDSIPAARDIAGGQMWWGDGSGTTIGGPTVHIDYVRFDNTGGYEPVGTLVPGDFDSDGDVDGADFVAWQTNFPTASGATLADGDADSDGDVDGADFVVWQTNFPFTPGSAGVSAIPEPHTWALATIGGVVAMMWRRRKVK